VLHIVCLAHLRDELARGGEFSIGRPYFGFAVAGSYRRSKSRRGRHHDLFDDTARSDPCPRILEGPSEIADIIGKLPRRVDTLPMQNISLDSKTFRWTAKISRKSYHTKGD